MGQVLPDLTVVFYTANMVPPCFGEIVRNHLVRVTDNLPRIWVSKQPMDYENNIVVDTPRSHISIYRDALVGVQAAQTKYVALCEDDVLYSPEHFKRRPSDGVFAYNLGFWNLQTWDTPMYTHKGRNRINLHALICDRDLFIKAMEERFEKFPAGSDPAIWAEPGKYERNLGVSEQSIETFYTNPPNIVFNHQTALSFGHLGTRKRLGEFRATELPYWGKAGKIRKIYEAVRPVDLNTSPE